jgi:aryl-alcohol dehydrogenase-like predicted oxidoreductase
MRLALGTANLGQRYGISNKVQVSTTEAIEIIRFAYSQGFRDFDTAPEYGCAEELIKKSLIGSESRIQIKIPAQIGSGIQEIARTVERSLRNLNLEKVDTIFFHDPKFYNSNNFPNVVESLINEGYSTNIGVSCYSTQDVIESYKKCKQLNSFQVPENILDRRIFRNSDILKLADDGCKFQVRSAFLQGLLLTNPDQFPDNLDSCRKSVKLLHNFAINHNVNLIQLLLSYAMQIKWADSVVVGANSVEQVKELADAAGSLLEVDWEQFESIPEPLIDPRNWN